MDSRLKLKSFNLGATDFGVSSVKGKRFFVVYNGKKINFGSDVGQTYFDHGDKDKKRNWYARHAKIKDKQGRQVIKVKTSPAYWSSHMLWGPLVSK
tara:strand:+ start:1811 stop:2098 length:288 start_codon:yes stop_codon:yes gene_type:complete